MKEVFDEIMSGIPRWIKMTILFLLFIFVCMVLFSCSYLSRIYPQDNFVEEVTEEIIKQKTGLDLDLSPGSPEKAVSLSVLDF